MTWLITILIAVAKDAYVHHHSFSFLPDQAEKSSWHEWFLTFEAPKMKVGKFA